MDTDALFEFIGIVFVAGSLVAGAVVMVVMLGLAIVMAFFRRFIDV